LPKNSDRNESAATPSVPRKWLWALFLGPILLALVLVGTVVVLAGNYTHNDALKWTVIAAVFTAGAALIALVGCRSRFGSC
jgi:hypothetical protein